MYSEGDRLDTDPTDAVKKIKDKNTQLLDQDLIKLSDVETPSTFIEQIRLSI